MCRGITCGVQHLRLRGKEYADLTTLSTMRNQSAKRRNYLSEQPLQCLELRREYWKGQTSTQAQNRFGVRSWYQGRCARLVISWLCLKRSAPHRLTTWVFREVKAAKNQGVRIAPACGRIGGRRR